MNDGTLVVVGSGINGVEQMTPAAKAWIHNAEKVVYIVSDTIAEQLILTLKPDAESLLPLYEAEERRRVSYKLMVNLMLGYLQTYSTVCAVFYGHPGIFAYPGHEAIRIARKLGYRAFMLPGVSAEDCLFADLCVDPAARGCQSYEATDFLARKRVIDPTAGLVLWQVSCIGNLTAEVMKEGFRAANLDVLAEVLTEYYGPDHQVVLYEAATNPLGKPTIDWLPIFALPKAEVGSAATMYVPPLEPVKLDMEMVKRLGLR